MTPSRSPGGPTTSPSRSSLGCLIAFLLPFAGIGLFSAIQAARAAMAGDGGQAAFLGVFALVFGGVGGGGIWGALVGHRRLGAAQALRSSHPEAPWLWRDDWAAGRIEDAGRGTMWATWFFAGFWNLVSLPAAIFAVREAVEKGNTAALIALVFPLVGIGLLVWAVRATVRYRRYGVSVLELAKTPASVGRGLTGLVRTGSALIVPEGFRVVLSGIRQVTRGSGKNRSTSESILWQDERRVSGRAGVIPIAFALSADAPPCDDRDSSDRVVWRLELSAEVPGVDYAATFEVPVFRTAESGEPRTPEEEILLRDPAAPAEYRQPADSRIRVTTNRRGTEIQFPAARNPGAALGVSLFLAIWTGLIWLMVHLGAPVFFPIVFGLFGLLLLYGALELWLRVTSVRVDAGMITVGSGYLSPGREQRIPVSELADVTARIGMQAGGRPYYDLTLVRTGGRRVTAGVGIRDKREAEWLVEVLRGAVGRG